MKKITLLVFEREDYMKRCIGIIMFLCFYCMVSSEEMCKKELYNQESRTLDKLLYFGTLAPSSHNAQMWKIKIVSENEFFIIFDKEKNLNLVDPDYRESEISIGAFLKNVIDGAKVLGVDMEYMVFDEIQSDDSIIHVTFKEKGTNSSKIEIKNFEELLLKRKTSKEKFLEKEVNQEVIKKIINNNGENVKYFAKGTPEFEYIRENTIKAYKLQGLDLNKRKELSNFFRFSDKEVSEKKDGFSAEMLGMDQMKKFFYYKFFNKEKVEDLNFLKEEMKIITEQTNSADGFLIIFGEKNSMKSNVSAGIILEEIWLNAARENIKIQPLSQMLEEKPFKSEISNKLGINGEVKMVLRTGYSGNNKMIKKNRKCVEDIVIK